MKDAVLVTDSGQYMQPDLGLGPLKTAYRMRFVDAQEMADGGAHFAGQTFTAERLDIPSDDTLDQARKEGQAVAAAMVDYGRETQAPWEYVGNAASTISVAVVVGCVIIARVIAREIKEGNERFIAAATA